MISYRFTPQQRLKTNKDFGFVLANAERCSSSLLSVFSRKNELKYPRLGLSIAKKRIKRAVDRNMIRRVIREYFRLHQHELGGVDLIFMMRHCPQRPEKKEIRQCTEQLWHKLKKYHAAD